jgi:hypothetical protein
MKKTIYRSVIQIEVLSPTPISESSNLSDIIDEGDFGEFSITHKFTTANKPVKGMKAVDLIRNQGIWDPEFFQMDDKGNEIEDEE